jgi:uncharacterized protein YciI
MKYRAIALASVLLAAAVAPSIHAAETAAAPPATYDPALAAKVGADERGMRRYVLVVLKTGPRRMPDGDARTAMFAGHMANITRLADAGKLALAGPFAQDPDGWRGLFLLAVESVEEARELTATDPVIVEGEMVAEYHPWYGTAAAMLLPHLHKSITPPR